MIKDTIVFDLDGTLANIDHRTHLLKQNKPDWRTFYSLCIDDTPNEWCVELMNSLSRDGFEILIVSARSKEVEKETYLWLRQHLYGIDYKCLLLRETNNTEPDTELKKKWLQSYDKERILFVVDDRTKVVDMWRAEGLVCLQCYRWEEYKRTKINEKTNN